LLARLESNLQGKTVTFIPTASIVEAVTFYVKSGRKALEKMGLIVDELEISTAAQTDIADKLARNDYIYVSGGNTFFLLQELKRCGADKIIREQVNAGKLYIGESAGSIVAAPDITYAAAMDSMKKAPGLENCAGLGLVDFYTVPHCTNVPFKRAAEKIIAQYGETLTLRPISNNEALLVCGDEVEVRGN